MESEIVKLYKYTIRYNQGEKDEYTVILVSDNMKDLIDLISEREMVESMNGTAKWLEIADFVLLINENEKGYHLFDINDQDLAVKYRYDVQEQYWTVLFKNDCPESVKNNDELLWEFENKIATLNNDDEWAKQFAYSGVLGEALYESRCVQNTIREKKREKDLHDAEELDAGIDVIEKIVKREEIT